MLQSRHGLALFATSLSIVLALTTVGVRSASEPTNPAEVVRLRAHFDSVLGELRNADVSRLTPLQAAARRRLIARLVEYSAAGRFPHNHVLPDRLVPVFRDEHRTLCAMGYLIASTGRSNIVDRVARLHNFAYLRELAADALLRSWLDSTGITLAEAARVQPEYCGQWICPRVTPAPDDAAGRDDRTRYALVSGVTTAVTGTALWLNLATSDATRARVPGGSWIGIAAGAAQVVFGAEALSQHDARRTMGFGNVALGGASLISNVWRLNHSAMTVPSGMGITIAPQPSPMGAGFVLTGRL